MTEGFDSPGWSKAIRLPEFNRAEARATALGKVGLGCTATVVHLPGVSQPGFDFVSTATEPNTRGAGESRIPCQTGMLPDLKRGLVSDTSLGSPVLGDATGTVPAL